MNSGLGISIGTVNTVAAKVTAEQAQPTVRTRRTTVRFDSSGGVHLGEISQFGQAVTDFADLSAHPDSVTVGGQIFSPATITAEVVSGLLTAHGPVAAAVQTYPARYSKNQVAALRQALHFARIPWVQLVPEPVAAAQWLEHTHGPLAPGYVLVYDLGGNSLDVTVLRVGPDWEHHPMLGAPERCYDFGGRPLGAMIARCAGDTMPPAQGMLSLVDPNGLRSEQVRDSLDVVRLAIHSAGITLSDIHTVLLTGGAARPPEVAQTLAELGRPVLMSADPGQTAAVGAAYLAAADIAEPPQTPHHPPIFSGAAIVSAVAMSAAAMFGSVEPDGTPILGLIPQIGELREELGGRDNPAAEPGRAGYTDLVSPVAYTHPQGATQADTRPGASAMPRLDRLQAPHGTYADPARFTNPMPFGPRQLHVPDQVSISELAARIDAIVDGLRPTTTQDPSDTDSAPDAPGDAPTGGSATADPAGAEGGENTDSDSAGDTAASDTGATPPVGDVSTGESEADAAESVSTPVAGDTAEGTQNSTGDSADADGKDSVSTPVVGGAAAGPQNSSDPGEAADTASGTANSAPGTDLGRSTETANQTDTGQTSGVTSPADPSGPPAAQVDRDLGSQQANGSLSESRGDSSTGGTARSGALGDSPRSRPSSSRVGHQGSVSGFTRTGPSGRLSRVGSQRGATDAESGSTGGVSSRTGLSGGPGSSRSGASLSGPSRSGARSGGAGSASGGSR